MPKVNEIPPRVGIKGIREIFRSNLDKRIEEHKRKLEACETFIDNVRQKKIDLNVSYYEITAKRLRKSIAEMEFWKEKVSDGLFARLLRDFNFHMIVALVNGYTWNLGIKMGRMAVSEIERTYKYDKNGNIIYPIDWVKTKEKWANGGTGFEHITSPTYNRIKWQWWTAKIRNYKIYSFKMVTTRKVKNFVSSFFKNNPHLRVYYNFEQSKEHNQRGYTGYRKMTREINDLPNLLRESCPW